MVRTVNSDEELDRLYGLPLEEFTQARNELGRELREAGEREAAEQVKALPKPSLSAWTVNQLARKERLQIRSLLTVGERLRNAQADLLQGGSPSELQEALQKQREVVGALLESAKGILQAAGHPATETTLERIRGTLSSAAGDEAGTRLLEAGRLTRDLDPAGFAALRLGAPTAGPPRAKRRGADEARKRRVEEAARLVEELRAEVAEGKAHARRAKGEARRAERAAEAAKEAAKWSEEELERLAARLEAARDALDRARSS